MDKDDFGFKDFEHGLFVGDISGEWNASYGNSAWTTVGELKNNFKT